MDRIVTAPNAQVPELLKHCTVITLDNRGAGESDKPESPPYSTHDFAEDAIAVLDAAKMARAHVYGYSMAGTGEPFYDMVRQEMPGKVFQSNVGTRYRFAA
jgi:pimeloyl-ACP methyl ester carboxylesterase